MKKAYNYILTKGSKIYYYDYDFVKNKSEIKSVDINNLSQSGIVYVYNKCKDVKTILGIKDTMEKELGFELEVKQLNLKLTYNESE